MQKENVLKAELFRNTRSGQHYIVVKYPDGNEEHLYDMIVAHCAKELTNNELKEVYRQCSKQLEKTAPDDIPPSFHELMNELTDAMVSRKCYDKTITP